MADSKVITNEGQAVISLKSPVMPSLPPLPDDRKSIVAWLRRPIAGEIHEVRVARLRYADEIEDLWDVEKAAG